MTGFVLSADWCILIFDVFSEILIMSQHMTMCLCIFVDIAHPTIAW